MEFNLNSKVEKQEVAPRVTERSHRFDLNDFSSMLEKNMNPDVSKTKKATEAILDTLPRMNGLVYENIEDMYPLVQERILVRREDVRTVLKSTLEESMITVAPDGLYPNVAWWDIDHGSEGLKNAFLEGRAHLDGVVSIVGFEPGMTMNVVDQKDIPDEPEVFHGANGDDLDRRFVASAKGSIPHENIRFVIFRFPFNHFPEEFLTDDEFVGGEKNTHGGLQYVFRGVYFPKQEDPTLH